MIHSRHHSLLQLVRDLSNGDRHRFQGFMRFDDRRLELLTSMERESSYRFGIPLGKAY